MMEFWLIVGLVGVLQYSIAYSVIKEYNEKKEPINMVYLLVLLIPLLPFVIVVGGGIFIAIKKVAVKVFTFPLLFIAELKRIKFE